jgi:hypothetical protein
VLILRGLDPYQPANAKFAGTASVLHLRRIKTAKPFFRFNPPVVIPCRIAVAPLCWPDFNLACL